MNHHLRSALLAAAFLALVACQQSETPPETREDIATAKTEATVDVAIAKAQGEHDVEVQRCEALTGDERQVCKDQADATLNAAMDAARGIREQPASQ